MLLWRSLDPKMLLAVLALSRPENPSAPETKVPAVTSKSPVTPTNAVA